MDAEEDTYSTIFNALRHPIRRRILKMLSEHPATYTEILNSLRIDNGLLNYHLENLRELVAKIEDRYTLSEYGRAALLLTKRIEDPVKDRKLTELRLPLFSRVLFLSLVVLLIGLFAMSYLYVDIKARYSEQNKIIEDIASSQALSEIELSTTVSGLVFFSEGSISVYSHVTLNNPTEHSVILHDTRFYMYLNDICVEWNSAPSYYPLEVDGGWILEVGFISFPDPHHEIYMSFEEGRTEYSVVVKAVADCGLHTESFEVNYTTSLNFLVPESADESFYIGKLTYVPEKLREYKSVNGNLTSAFLPAMIEVSNMWGGGRLVPARMNVYTLEVEEKDSLTVYYLLRDNYEPEMVPCSLYQQLINKTLYVNGYVFNYYGADGKNYKVLRPIEFNETKLENVAELAHRYLNRTLGEDYVRSHFHSPYVDKNPIEPIYRVRYMYRLEVGDYQQDQEVLFDYNSLYSLDSTNCMPSVDDLMPYSITQEQAINIAVKAELPVGSYPMEASLHYRPTRVDNETGRGREYRYLWVVKSWLDPPEAQIRGYMGAYVDPKTGQVIKVFEGSQRFSSG